MGKVFINYRTQTGPYQAKFLWKAIEQRLSGVTVFIDQKMSPGLDWIDQIPTEISTSDVFIVVVTREWFDTFKEKKNSSEEDYVLKEFDAVLHENSVRRGKGLSEIKIIPVMFDTSEKPLQYQKRTGTKLPKSVHDIFDKQAAEIIGQSQAAVDKLLEEITRYFGIEAGEQKGFRFFDILEPNEDYHPIACNRTEQLDSLKSFFRKNRDANNPRLHIFLSAHIKDRPISLLNRFFRELNDQEKVKLNYLTPRESGFMGHYREAAGPLWSSLPNDIQELKEHVDSALTPDLLRYDYTVFIFRVPAHGFHRNKRVLEACLEPDFINVKPHRTIFCYYLDDCIDHEGFFKRFFSLKHRLIVKYLEKRAIHQRITCCMLKDWNSINHLEILKWFEEKTRNIDTALELINTSFSKNNPPRMYQVEQFLRGVIRKYSQTDFY